RRACPPRRAGERRPDSPSGTVAWSAQRRRLRSGRHAPSARDARADAYADATLQVPDANPPYGPSIQRARAWTAGPSPATEERRLRRPEFALGGYRRSWLGIGLPPGDRGG